MTTQEASFGEGVFGEDKLRTLNLECWPHEEKRFVGIMIEVDVESWIHNPAVRSSSDLYLIQGDKLIGKVRMSSARGGANGLYETVSIQPDDDATRAFFEGDPGWLDGYLYGLKYSGITGEPFVTDESEEERHKDTRIVDRFYFDWGLCHKSFSTVEGFDNYHKRPKPRNHVQQKQRRPRNSNKIKKVR